MHTGLFFMIFGVLLAVIALGVPLPIGPRAPHDALPELDAPARCLELTYTGGADRYMPTRLRLESDFAAFVAPPRAWYRAEASSPSWSQAAWRPWGRDSIDIASYHSPRIRLPAFGERLEGQVVPTGAFPLFVALWVAREPVRATYVACQ